MLQVLTKHALVLSLDPQQPVTGSTKCCCIFCSKYPAKRGLGIVAVAHPQTREH